MYRSAYLIFAFLSLLDSAISQNGNNLWYFGNNAGLDFSLGYPVAVLDGALVTADNTATVSDPITGELLFYSNGVEVWNRNHDVMPNGHGLLGNWSGGTSAIAVKLPGNNQIYYLFTTDAFAWPNGLRYSIIDLELDNGLGDVTNQKNIIVNKRSTEKVAITRHANEIDYWIVTHTWNSDEYHVYGLNEQGLSQYPIISKIGLLHGGDSYNAMGQIAFSQDGLRLASAVYFTHFELFRFDPSNGQLSDQKILNGHLNAWGVQFSQNNDFLYATRWKNDEIIQFDLTSDDEDLINESMTIIGYATGPNSLYKAGYLQTGPDNRIYVAKYESQYLGAIENPNSKGLISNYIDNAVFLGGHTCQAGLANQVFSNTLLRLPSYDSDYIIGIPPIYVIYPNPNNGNFSVKVFESKEVTFELYSTDGKLVFQDKRLFNAFEETKYSMHLMSGNYTVRLIINERLHEQKLIILND